MANWADSTSSGQAKSCRVLIAPLHPSMMSPTDVLKSCGLPSSSSNWGGEDRRQNKIFFFYKKERGTRTLSFSIARATLRNKRQ